MKAKIGILGCKSTTHFLIENLIEKIQIDYVITINEKLGEKFNVADYYDISGFSKGNNINVYQVNQYNLKSKEDLDFFSKIQLDLVFVIGWQRLIPEKILKTFSIGAFGMHGSSMDLPLGRGRSPMNWSLIEDKKFFYTNLFKYNSGIDSGDILDTMQFSIYEKDNAETMHFKNTLSMKYLIYKNIDKLLSNNFSLKKQQNLTPTYYPKRNPCDSLIDWQADIYKIERFIRAVTKPFNGAYSFIKNKKITIFDAQIFETSYFGCENELNGRVVEVFPNGKFLVKCIGGLLIINKYIFSKRILKGEFLSIGNEKIHYFKTNKYGNYDIEKTKNN